MRTFSAGRALRTLTGAIALTVVVAQSATAQSVDWDRCLTAVQTPDIAIPACTKLIESGEEPATNVSRLFYNRGLGHFHQNRHDDAVADFRRAIEQDITFAGPHAMLGDVARARNDLVQAIAHYSDAIGIDPQDFHSRTNRGVVFVLRGEFERAIADYDEAVRANPLEATSYVRRGYAKEGLRDFSAAIEDYDQATRIDPNYGAAYLQRGILWHTQLNELGRAVADYDEVLRLDPSALLARYNRGSALIGLGDIDRAIEDLSYVISRDASVPAPFTMRGLAHEGKGDAELARADYAEALRRPAAGPQPEWAHKTARERLEALITGKRLSESK